MAGIPQVITSDRASGAQVIDGSLKIDSDLKNHLEKDFSSDGNRRTWTWSSWVKKPEDEGFSDDGVIFEARIDSPSADADIFGIRWRTNGRIIVYDTGNSYIGGTREFRDTSAFYHLVLSVDTTQASNNISLYVNGDLYLQGSYTQNSDTRVNSSAATHRIGARTTVGSQDGHFLSSQLSQCYLIDGQALGPENFGFTDPLTNTWKPKKYVNTTASHGDVGGVVGFGTNGFYLPFDGSAPIGQDQSGQGNNWTPVNFGGSVSLDNPIVSGARPILNTTQGGSQAGVGVFGSKQNVGYAVTYYDDGDGNKYYIDGVKQATLTGLIRGATYTFDTVALGSTHPFRFSDSDGGSEYTNGVAAITGTATTITIPYNAPNELYYYCTAHSGMGSSITGITTNEKLADQYASNCTIALPFIGTSPVDVSASIACTTSTKTLGTNGTPTTDVSNFYASSPHLVGNASWYTLATTDDVEMGTGDYTLETYVYFHSFPVTWNYIFANEGSNTSGFAGWIVKNDGKVFVTYYNGSTRPDLESAAGSVTTGKWYHLAWSRVSGTQHIFVDGVCVARGTWSENVNSSSDARWGTNPASTSTEYGNLSLSDFRIYKGVGKYTASAVGEQAFVVPSVVPDILPDTPSGVSGSSKLTKITDGAVAFDGTGDYMESSTSADYQFGTGDFTVECFVYLKKDNANQIMVGNWGSSDGWQLYFTNTGDKFAWYSDSTLLISSNTVIKANRWYHVAAARSGSTTKLFVDGILEGSASDSTDYNQSKPLEIGRQQSTNTNLLDGFISNIRIVKGTALYTSRFTPPTAPLTNVTNTKLLTCQSVGIATAAAVSPGIITAYGDAAATNFNPFNTDIHTVRGQETGYATLNPLFGELTLSDGNLHAVGVSNWGSHTADFLMSSGKWYYEYHDVVSNEHVIGIGPPDVTITGNLGSGDRPGFGYGSETGVKYSDGGNSSYGDSWTSGDVIGVAFDADAGELSFYKNGIDQGVAFTGLTTEYVPVISINGTSRSASVNFGQKPFKFPPPDGFQPLNTANKRPETVIARPDQYVGVVTYTSDSSNPISIRSFNFKPDMIWGKDLDDGNNWHQFDSVRGPDRSLDTTGTSAETDWSSYFLSFDDNGFTVAAGNHDLNRSTNKMCSWGWKAGGRISVGSSVMVDNVGFATAGDAGLTAGDTIPTGASVGTKQGFSIIKYTGPNDTNNHEVPHGLSQAPDFIIAKNLDNTYNWDIYHSSLADDAYLIFTGAATRAQGFNGRPTSTVFKTEHDYSTNENEDYIAYCWHNVSGLQKFGTYQGNQSSDGPYVELGFRPRVLWIKNIDRTSTDWRLLDSEREKFNDGAGTKYVLINSSDNQADNSPVDFLSNGFKIRTTTADGEINYNAANDDYIYCAWAEAPSVDLYGGGSNAR